MPQSGCRLWRRQNKSVEFTEDSESGVELSSVKTKDPGEDQLPGSMTRREKSGTFFHPCPQPSLPESGVTFSLEVPWLIQSLSENLEEASGQSQKELYLRAQVIAFRLNVTQSIHLIMESS